MSARAVPAAHAAPRSLGGRYAASRGMEAYRREYGRGWAAAGRTGVSREWDEGRSSAAFDDGYLDRAAGRERWHMTRCVKHDRAEFGGCGEM